MKPIRRSRPRWRYDPERSVLDVSGSHFLGDLRAIKQLFDQGKVPITIDAVVYWSRNLDVPLVIRGHVLSDWVTAGDWPHLLWHFQTQPPPRHTNWTHLSA